MSRLYLSDVIQRFLKFTESACVKLVWLGHRHGRTGPGYWAKKVLVSKMVVGLTLGGCFGVPTRPIVCRLGDVQ